MLVVPWSGVGEGDGVGVGVGVGFGFASYAAWRKGLSATFQCVARYEPAGGFVWK